MFKGFPGLDKARTFRPKRNHRVGTKRYELHKYAQATLGTGNLHEAVTLPEGEDLHEWLAVNTVDFFNEINLLYGVIAEFCTDAACPVMCAGPKYEYMWADGLTVKKPMAVSAPRYVDFLMTWVQNQLDDEKLFPTQIGARWPPPRAFPHTLARLVSNECCIPCLTECLLLCVCPPCRYSGRYGCPPSCASDLSPCLYIPCPFICFFESLLCCLYPLPCGMPPLGCVPCPPTFVACPPFVMCPSSY